MLSPYLLFLFTILQKNTWEISCLQKHIMLMCMHGLSKGDVVWRQRLSWSYIRCAIGTCLWWLQSVSSCEEDPMLPKDVHPETCSLETPGMNKKVYCENMHESCTAIYIYFEYFVPIKKCIVFLSLMKFDALGKEYHCSWELPLLYIFNSANSCSGKEKRWPTPDDRKSL